MTSASIFKSIKDRDVLTLRRILSSSDHGHTIKDQQGRTPLHLACQTGAYECVKELLAKRASTDVSDQSGNLPIHLACMAEQGGREIVTELLNGHGRKLTAKKKNAKTGHTPLHLAAMHGNLEVVVALLDAGVRWDAKDAAGNAPLDLVPLASPHYETLALILSTGDAAPARSLLPHHTPHTPIRSPAPATPTAGLYSNGTPGSKTPGVRASMQLDSSRTPPSVRASVQGVTSRIGSGATPGQSKIGQGQSPMLQTRPSGIPIASPAPHDITTTATATTPSSALRTKKSIPVPTSADTPSAALPTYSAAGPTPTPGAILHRAATPVGSTGGAGRPASTPAASGGGGLTGRATPTPVASAGGGAASRSVAGSAGGAGAGSTAVMQLVVELSQRVDEMQARADASEAARREVEEHLLQAQAMVKEQAERLDAVESKLSQLEEERSQEAAARDAALPAAPTQHVDELQSQQDSLLKSMIQMQSKYDALLGSVSKLQTQVAFVNPYATPPSTPPALVKSLSVPAADQTTSQLEELSAKVAALASKAVTQADLDPVKQRLSRLEALGIADQLAILQLRAQQLGNNLSDITNQQLDLSNTLAGLVHGPAAGTEGAGPTAASLEAALSKAVTQLTEQDTAQQAMQQQLAAMQEQLTELASKPVSAPPAPPAPPAHSGIPGAPATPLPASQHPPLTPPSTTRSAALAMASAANTTQVLDELQHQQGALHRDVAALKLSVEELRAELAVTSGALKRDWTSAVEEAGQRYAEQSAELKQKEERVKAMRDSMLSEGDARAVAAALEQRVTSALAGIDTRLGLLQHKVELVEYQVQAGAEESRGHTPYTSLPGSRLPTASSNTSTAGHAGGGFVSSIPRAVAEEREAEVGKAGLGADHARLVLMGRPHSAEELRGGTAGATGAVQVVHTKARAMDGHAPYSGSMRKRGALPVLISRLFNRKPTGWAPGTAAYTTHNLVFDQGELDSGDELTAVDSIQLAAQLADGDGVMADGGARRPASGPVVVNLQ